MDKRREKRNKEAVERNTRWDAMTPSQKLAELDTRLGIGVGAKKQREQLLLTQFELQPAKRG